MQDDDGDANNDATGQLHYWVGLFAKSVKKVNNFGLSDSLQAHKDNNLRFTRHDSANDQIK